MATKARDGKGRFVKTAPRKRIAEVGKECMVCHSKLVKLPVDSRAEVPSYATVCNNPDCSVYRIIVTTE